MDTRRLLCGTILLALIGGAGDARAALCDGSAGGAGGPGSACAVAGGTVAPADAAQAGSGSATDPTATAAAPPTAVAPAAPVVAPGTPRRPSKLRVLRAAITGGQLDLLLMITARAATPGASLTIEVRAAGAQTTFAVPITGRQIKVLRTLPPEQAAVDTGIVTISYAGNAIVNPDGVRLRAAPGKADLTRTTSWIDRGTLKVAGTITTRAKGVVRVRLDYVRPDGTTGTLTYEARIISGFWKLRKKLPAEAAHGGQLSIQFTGYLPRGVRGEQRSKQVLG